MSVFLFTGVCIPACNGQWCTYADTPPPSPPKADIFPPPRWPLKRAVRILLECILGSFKCFEGHESFLWGHWYPLFWIYGDVCREFQSQGGYFVWMLPFLHAMDSSDSPLIGHLRTSQGPRATIAAESLWATWWADQEVKRHDLKSSLLLTPPPPLAPCNPLLKVCLGQNSRTSQKWDLSSHAMTSLHFFYWIPPRLNLLFANVQTKFNL